MSDQTEQSGEKGVRHDQDQAAVLMSLLDQTYAIESFVLINANTPLILTNPYCVLSTQPDGRVGAIPVSCGPT